MPAMLQMYHAGLARLQSQQYSAPYPGQALSALWPTHSHLTHGVQSLIQSPSLHLPAQPSTKTFFRPTEDSCGGSSGSASSDTNGSDTNSGDEVSYKRNSLINLNHVVNRDLNRADRTVDLTTNHCHE